MRRYVFIGIGGALGAVARYLIRNLEVFQKHLDFPYGTLAVNIVGAFLIAFIMTLAFEVIELDIDIRMGMVTGFLGGFTTFSTLTKETYFLLMNGHWMNAILYGIGSLLLGLLGVYCGVLVVRRFFRKSESLQEEVDV